MIYSFCGLTPQISDKAYIADTATVIGDVIVEADCYVGPGAVIRGDKGSIRIGEGTAVEDGVIIHAVEGSTSCIGTRVVLGHGAIIHGSVDDNAVIGMAAVVSIGASVGAWAIVGEGSVVKMNQVIEPYVVAVGSPAKAVRKLEERDIALWDEGKEVYIDLARKCLNGGLEAVSR
ncbi:MAG: gamma carbonic anhydrase family protein [Coriobacteriia bacterium]|nr:gamma carbonic anhydrase family protein [Coriobacteriia bacterium]